MNVESSWKPTSVDKEYFESGSNQLEGWKCHVRYPGSRAPVIHGKLHYSLNQYILALERLSDEIPLWNIVVYIFRIRVS